MFLSHNKHNKHHRTRNFKILKRYAIVAKVNLKRGTRGIINFCVLYSHLLFSNIGIRALIKHFLIALLPPNVFLMRKIRKNHNAMKTMSKVALLGKKKKAN